MKRYGFRYRDHCAEPGVHIEKMIEFHNELRIRKWICCDKPFPGGEFYTL